MAVRSRSVMIGSDAFNAARQFFSTKLFVGVRKTGTRVVISALLNCLPASYQADPRQGVVLNCYLRPV